MLATPIDVEIINTDLISTKTLQFLCTEQVDLAIVIQKMHVLR